MLSDITVHSKYARYIEEENRRETWEEIVERNVQMHKERFPKLAERIDEVYERSVLTKKILPSMRSLQFGGAPIERNHSRIYNCAYLPVEHPDAFSETMFLLLGGTGVGYSVQKQHIAKLDVVMGPRASKRRYIVADSIEGWADAVKVLVEAFYYHKMQPRFDFSDIREKGSRLVTSGGKAPGPKPLKECLEKVQVILEGAVGRKLKPIEAHDIQCLLADAVLAGGIRRAAMISLFSHSDEEMLYSKSGNWWIDNPQRSRANNSVALLRNLTTKEMFNTLWAAVKASGAGEPGFYWTNNLDWGTNPCCEIALRPYQFCNLTEINASNIVDQRDFNSRARDAAFIGTLQAGYTDFHYLRNVWKVTTEEDALIGVGMTGIASKAIDELYEEEAAMVVNATNLLVSAQIGINKAARTTTVKPSGTSSLVVGSSSGIHAWHDEYYIRRMRFGKDEAIYQYLAATCPDLCEDEYFRPDEQGVVSIPQRAPLGSTTRAESALELLSRVRRYNSFWVGTGHNRGENVNNVSCTINIRDDEWHDVREWMWDHRNKYNGISVLPYDGGTYKQAPFETITEELFNEMSENIPAIDLRQVMEEQDETNLAMEAACSGGFCELP